MSKMPFIQLFTGDCLKDPTVGALSPAARGIWWDFIFVMHEADRSGVIAGNRAALSRLTRCSTDELAGALAEFQLYGTADVSEDGNGIVTVINRRMKRDADARKHGANRQQRARAVGDGNGVVTPPDTPPSRDILHKSEVISQKEGSDKVSKPFQGGGPGGGLTERAKGEGRSANQSLSRLQAEVARFSEDVLNGQWTNDAGKWMERIKADPDRVLRVMGETKSAALEGRIKTTPAQYAQFAWEKVFK